MGNRANRLAFVDGLKAIGSQLIVLHHLAFYGPMSDVAQELAPNLIAWLSRDARIAVQVFLVVGGFLAAKALAPYGRLIAVTPFETLTNRYFKLVIPYFAALLLAVACSALARNLFEHDATPSVPDAGQFIAHILLLHGLLEIDALTAGAWYIAIDFQLFAILLGILWFCRHTRAGATAGPLGTAALGILSLYYFNRDPSWDNWGLYFFGSYALGALAFWISSQKNAGYGLLVMAIVTAAALGVDFRSRIAIALLVALALGMAHRTGRIKYWPKSPVLAYLGQISYGVFLVNFPIGLVVNAIFARYTPENPWLNALGMLLAWFSCLVGGALFFHYIERRARTWQSAGSELARRFAKHLQRVIP